MPAPAPSPRILVVRLSSIGDILLVTPLLRALRRAHPAADITFVTKAAFAPLVTENPNVTRVETLAPGESLSQLAGRLRRLAPTHGLDVHGNLRSLALRALVRCRWRGFRKRRLARLALITTKRNLYGTPVPMAERYFEAARDLGVAPDGKPAEFFVGAAAKTSVAAFLQRREPGAGSRMIAFAPGAAHFTKRWPAEYWRELGRTLAAEFRILLVGGPDDRALAEGLAAEIPGAVSAAGQFGLQETGAALARSAAVVSGDTGVMHMATAVGVPVVALFGPTVRAFGFVPYRARAEVIERDLDCRPCSAQGTAQCPLGHHRCLRDIAALEVERAVRRMVA
jgi:lipopolysaccharide heptosyltransferase II